MIAVCGVFALSSCGGGWTEENKTQMKDTCSSLMKIRYDEADATAICSCYIDGLVKKYPNADFTPEQNTAEMDACSGNYKTTFEKQSEAAGSMDTMMEGETTAPAEGEVAAQ
ncbi:MAG: hypothetical protein ACOVP5_04905 [Chitinophagales bacterium]|jgi:hypothetical protein